MKCIKVNSFDWNITLYVIAEDKYRFYGFFCIFIHILRITHQAEARLIDSWEFRSLKLE